MSTDVVYQPRLARRFNLPSMDDFSRWNQSWDQVLERFSSSEDVFAILKDTWELDQQGPSALSDLPTRIRNRVLRSQELASKLLYELDLRDFSMVYALMREEQIKEHFFNGLREACAQSSLQEDARALCPEISTRMLSNRLLFKFFLVSFSGCTIEAGEGNVALLHSDWWNAAVKMPEPWPEDIKFAFTQLTVQRNEFITAFILHSVVSIVRELNFTSPIANLLKSEGFFSSSAWSYTSPITTPIRCTYCTGSSDELGKKLKFMICTRCKANANTIVCYCSRSCQVADWDDHKPNCGKIKPPPPNARDHVWHYVTPDLNRPRNMMRRNVTSSCKASVPGRPLSPGLRRQVALLKASPEADYFLFDDQDRPIPFVMSSPDRMLNQNFFHFQEECMFGRELKGLEVIAEYLIKVMGEQPGLSKAGILKQLSKEYQVDVAQLVAGLQSRKAEKGYDPKKTFMEEMGRDMLKIFLRPES